MKNPILLFVFLAAASIASAELRLPDIFGDRMVLQREMPVPVWGWSEPGAEVRVSFAGQTVTTHAAEDGTWSLRLAALPASSEGRVMRIVSSSNTNAPVTLSNVVVGEVWICSGQSNMEWTLNNSQNGKDEVAAADDALLRHIKIAKRKADRPMDSVQHSGWVPSSPGSAAHFTAVGTFFARVLREELGVPVGLIGANWSGSKIEPWISPEAYRKTAGLESLRNQVDVLYMDTEVGRLAHKDAIAKIQNWLPIAEAAMSEGVPPPDLPLMPSLGSPEPTAMFNAMIYPLAPFALRGALWYQGESNWGDRDYDVKMKALINGWRTLWGQGTFPFYFVQLSSWQADENTPEGGANFSRIRELQRKSLKIPDTGMAVTVDIGNPKNIHPANKQDVGRRLARWALHRDYGRTHLIPSGPLYREHTIEGHRVRIAFDYVGSGLMVGSKEGLDPVQEVTDGSAERFALCGADRKWVWADVEIDGDTVVVSSPDVPEPVAVRYAYSASPMGHTLYSRDGLPASPFRTDNF